MSALLHTLIALVAFLGMSAGVRALIPWPLAHGLRAKLEYFEGHADEFDAVFVGSSRVVRGVVPRVLERELEAQGIEFRAFNFGLGGMEDFEADRVVREVLDLAGNWLQWVFVESGRWDPRFGPEDLSLTRRNVEWHTVANGRALMEAILALDIPLEASMRLGRKHFALCATRLVGYGRGRDVWRQVTGEENRRAEVDDRIQGEQELDRNLGWQATAADGAGLAAEKWRTQVEKAWRRELNPANVGLSTLATLPLKAIRRQIEYIQERVPNLTCFNASRSAEVVLCHHPGEAQGLSQLHFLQSTEQIPRALRAE